MTVLMLQSNGFGVTGLHGKLEGVHFLDHQGVLDVLLALDELLVLHIRCHLFRRSEKRKE